MSDDVLTVAGVRRAIALIKDQRLPDHCPPHLVHPKYRGWEIVDRPEDATTLVRCATLCGWAALMRPRAS